ncbi:DUF16 domain-containing protein [Clostridium sp.]|uniref:DUF16 domain-containing protein n=1 Tax=Clostridium sp. TaxID=1506 RepID=UPI00261F1EA0|nr:DUF16 domain-containing protein [Clostridium sp.]
MDNNINNQNANQGDILGEINDKLEKHESAIILYKEKIDKHDEELKKHEEKIDKHNEELTEIKVSSSAQGQAIQNLNKNIEKLNQTIEKIGDKFDTYVSSENKGKIKVWEIAVVSVLLPLVFFLLNFIASNFQYIIKTFIK